MKILGLDCSTQSLAFGIIEDGVLLSYGEYFFDGSNVYARATDAMIKTKAMLSELTVDYIAIEKTVMVRSIDTAIKMALTAGAVLAVLGEQGSKIVEVPPISWQSFINNKPIVGIEKRTLLAEHKELKTKAQIQKYIREYRKNRTIAWVKETFDTEVTSNNISDAIGVAYFAAMKLVIA